MKKAKKSKSKKEAKKEIDVLAHNLVPKMEIIKEDAKNRILEKYNITGPPKVMWGKHDAEPGDVIKIEREDATGKYNVYRIVVPK